MKQQQQQVYAWYNQRETECQLRLDVLHRQDKWLSRLRGLTFLPSLGFFYYGVFYAATRWPWFCAVGGLVTAFVVLVRKHERVSNETEEMQLRLESNRVQLARLERNWDRVPPCVVPVPPAFQSISTDLDLFGRASLFQLVSQAHTPFGTESLRDWLLVPASPAEVAQRHEAVSFLAPAGQLREEVDLRGRMLGSSPSGTLDFVQWAEAAPWLGNRIWLTWFVWLCTGAIVIIPLAGVAGVLEASIAFIVVTAILCANLALNVLFAGKVRDIIGRVTARSHNVQHYRPLLETITRLPADVPFFAQLQSRLGATPDDSLRSLAELMRVVRFANLRRDGLFGLPYYLAQLFVLIDFHVLGQLERWQRRHGHRVRGWLDAVGQLEAISSLSTLAHDHPHWSLPIVEDLTEKKITATQLAHPLLADDKAVANDVEVGPVGTFMLVTGSNMSGKSTLLRAMGVNVTLAQAGGPVCAHELRLPPLEMATCIRIRDSLVDGVSFFLAELQRLKQIVDQARECQRNSPRKLLYLLDEMLQGTNSAERHIAVLRVIGHLVQHDSIGMVTTHDLELAHSEELSPVCRTVHFRETIISRNGEQQMTFDYQLRAGLAPTTNALKLLEFVGLGE